MLTPASFSYATVRVVPRVEREEFLNCGVIVFSLERKYLNCRLMLNPHIAQLWPDLDLEETADQLEAIERICQGVETAGPIAMLSQRERFHWLVAPRSTVVQLSPVHTGISADLEKTLTQLFCNLCDNICL